MKILFCSDGSRKAEEAIRFGTRIVTACRAEPSILAIAEKPGDEATLREALGQSQKIFTRHHLKVQLSIETGNPVSVIAKHCKKTNYDLVVVGAAASRHFWRLLEPRWMSGNVYKIVESVTSPVLVVIGNRTHLRRILLCSGGAVYIDKAIKFTGHIAQCLEAVIDLFHVMPETPAMYDEMFQRGDEVEWLLESNSKLGQNLRRQKELLEQFGVFGEIRLHRGEVVPELLRELHQNDYDLVVAGSSPAEDIFSRFVMSNVTEEIVNRAMLPVLVVRTKQRLIRRFFNMIQARLFGKLGKPQNIM